MRGEGVLEDHHSKIPLWFIFNDNLFLIKIWKSNEINTNLVNRTAGSNYFSLNTVKCSNDITTDIYGYMLYWSRTKFTPLVKIKNWSSFHETEHYGLLMTEQNLLTYLVNSLSWLQKEIN